LFRHSDKLTFALALIASLLPAADASCNAPSGMIVQKVEPTGRQILGAPVYRNTIVSPRYRIDGIHRSMKGPQSAGRIVTGDPKGQNELLWITAHYTEIVEGDSDQVTSPEFMCHSNLDFAGGMTYENRRGRATRQRMFTLSQGQMQVRFPEGYGIPIESRRNIRLGTQVLNLNPQPHAMSVRHRAVIEYERQSDLASPMKPLIVITAQGLKAVDESGTARQASGANHRPHSGAANHDRVEPGGVGAWRTVRQPIGHRSVLARRIVRFISHGVQFPGSSRAASLD
jgi:hypothetical protein